MKKGLKYSLMKTVGYLSYNLLKILPTGGKSYPGYLFLRYAGLDSLGNLAKEQIKDGSILITGTNGKTTTTTMIIDLMSNDVNISKNVDNNTIYALTTALLAKKSDIGIFEYGIRDLKHGIPDVVEKNIKPKVVVYTNVSCEHTQVLGVKNSFEDYVKAKTLLSKNMKDGIVVANADDPIICNIGQEKQNDGHVVYYGFNVDNIEDDTDVSVMCPKCNKPLTYSHKYMNQRGVYSCSCGFKRCEPDVKITKYSIENNKNIITIDANVYNYFVDENISFTLDLELPLFGVHNVYNVLAATSTYACFTPKPENIEEKLKNYFNNIDLSILPPGRFEVLEYADKLVGIGQGDNGDALKVNYDYMNYFIQGNDYEFIYCTPDLNEEEIFEDHLNILKKINPTHITVIPGRVSVDVAKTYYTQIKDNNLNASFKSIEYDFEKRASGIIDSINESEYKYVVVSGCGEEHDVWNVTLNKLKE